MKIHTLERKCPKQIIFTPEVAKEVRQQYVLVFVEERFNHGWRGKQRKREKETTERKENDAEAQTLSFDNFRRKAKFLVSEYEVGRPTTRSR